MGDIEGVCDYATLSLFSWDFFLNKLSLVLSSLLYSSATEELEIGSFLSADIAEKIIKVLTFPSCLSSFVCCSSSSLRFELLV